MVDVIERVDAVQPDVRLWRKKKREVCAYYANPPQIPSKQTKPNTSQMLSASTPSLDPSPGPKMPFADSNDKREDEKLDDGGQREQSMWQGWDAE